MTPDERHAVAGELRWLADQREKGSVMSPDWLRQRADWIEVSGERRAPAREPSGHTNHNTGERCNCGDDPERWREQQRADALDSIVLRWGEPS